MQLLNVILFGGAFQGSMVFWSAPSGRLALRYIKINSKKSAIRNTLLVSVIACFFFSIIGYLSLFAGAQMLDYQNEHSIWLYVGYILMWPTMLTGYIINHIGGKNSFGLLTMITAQLSGYLVMGLVVYYVRNRLNIRKINQG
jgi:hypothetical protein